MNCIFLIAKNHPQREAEAIPSNTEVNDALNQA